MLEVILSPAPVLLPLHPGERVVAAAAGRAHSVLVTSNGRALSLSSNSYGQCGRVMVEEEDYTRWTCLLYTSPSPRDS